MSFDEWNHSENTDPSEEGEEETKAFSDTDDDLDEFAEEIEEEEELRKAEEENKNAMPFSEERYTFVALTGKNRPGNSTFSYASLITGALSVIFGFAECKGICFILALAAVGFSLLSRKRQGYFDGKSIAGLFLAVFGAVVGIAFWILEAVEAANEPQAPAPAADAPKTDGINAWKCLARFFRCI